MASMLSYLEECDLLKNVFLPSTLDLLLRAVEVESFDVVGDRTKGQAKIGLVQTGAFSLDIATPFPSVPYSLLVTDAATGSFRLWFVLSAVEPAAKVFDFAAGLVGNVLVPAVKVVENGATTLTPAPPVGDPDHDTVHVTGVEVALLIDAEAGQQARLRFTPNETTAVGDGIVTLALDPPTVMLGSSGFGLELPHGFVIDDSDGAAAEGPVVLAGRELQPPPPSAEKTWRGLLVRNATLYIPAGVPLLGSRAVDAYVEIGLAPGSGIDLVVHTSWEPDDAAGDPGGSVLIECRDPGARGLADFVPTLVEITTDFTHPAAQTLGPAGAFEVLGERPLTARARFSRAAADPVTRLKFTLEAGGPLGVLTVRGSSPAGRAVVGAAAFATALVATGTAPDDQDASGAVLSTVLVAGLGLSAFLDEGGRVVVNSVSIESEGSGVPVGGAVRLLLDYSVDVAVTVPSIGAFSISMDPDVPMRVRNRNVGLTFHPERSGLDKFDVDFSRADMEVEDPGRWQVGGPSSLFDVLGTRSGRGSVWLEVDLRFKLNLGPIEVSGATVRLTFDGAGPPAADIRGLDVTLTLPGVVEGRGHLRVLPSAPNTPVGGFAAELDVRVIPLNLAAGAAVAYVPQPDGAMMLVVWLGVDLPAPIPLANSGFGLFGIAGGFGINAEPATDRKLDPITRELRWDSSDVEGAYRYRVDNVTFGVEAAIGTLPDLGFTFSAKGGFFLTVPDVAVRASVMGRVLGSRLGVTDRPQGPGLGMSYRGVASVVPDDAITVALEGTLVIPVLLEATIPVAARFPVARTSAGSTVEPRDWFIHLGADGYTGAPQEGRAMGPIRAEILPDFLPAHADVYLMLRGNGITQWPRGQAGSITVTNSLVIACGFSFGTSIGLRPLVWASIEAGADILLTSNPLSVAGFGYVRGSLHLGPFSIGVHATLDFWAMEGHDPYITAKLCARVDLFFFELEGCVEISTNGAKNELPLAAPPHPLDEVRDGAVVGHLVYAVDDRFRRIAPLTEDPAAAPTVFPDSLLHLAFAVSPDLATFTTAGQFPTAEHYEDGPPAERVGNAMVEYSWALDRLRLFDITTGSLVHGPLSATWQVGREGSLGGRPQAGDLVLLTYRNDLWLSTLADGGAGLPVHVDPVRSAGHRCTREASPSLGWALAHGARAIGTGFELPPDVHDPDPTVSRFTATVTHHLGELGSPTPLTSATAALLPLYVGLVPASLASLTVNTRDRAFDTVLQLSAVTTYGDTLPARTAPNYVSIVLSDALSAGGLWLVVSPIDNRIDVGDDLGQQWFISEEVTLVDGRSAVRYGPPSDASVRWITLWTYTFEGVGVLGVNGITQKARDAAAARAAGWMAASARDAAAAAAPLAESLNDTHVRCILEPGHSYRLDIDMSWTGVRSDQDDKGVITQRAPESDSISRAFYFKTAVARNLLPPQHDDVHFGAAGAFTFVKFSKPEYFRPELLSRHLAGYTPGQSETDRFRDDPIAVHFVVEHISALLKAYGYTMLVTVRRLDAPGPAGELVEVAPQWGRIAGWVLSSAAAFGFTAADLRRFEIASTAACTIPTPGATASIDAHLEPQSWYEVYVKAKSSSAATADGRLDGVSFRTSRWLSPREMLTALGLSEDPTVITRPTGDLEVVLPDGITGTVDAEDSAFDTALRALGVEGLPTPATPRISVLWVRPGGTGQPWRCAGILLESPEPIVRPNRLDSLTVRRVDTSMGHATPFDVTRSDHTQSRILLLASTPFDPSPRLGPVTGFDEPLRQWAMRPVRGVTLSFQWQDRLTGSPCEGRSIIRERPTFAEEE